MKFQLYRLVLAALAASMLGFGASDAAAQTTPPALANTACLVAFGVGNGAASAARPGLFSSSGSARVSTIYRLQGIDDARMQRITDELCAAFDAGLQELGANIATEPFRAHANYQRYLDAGVASGASFGDRPVEYRVFAPTGARITHPAFSVGTGVDNLRIREAGVANAIGAQPVRAVFQIDFAEVDARRDRGVLTALVGQRTAEVEARVGMRVNLAVTTYDATRFRCWNRFGMAECNPADVRRTERTWAPDAPLQSSAAIVSVADTTTGGQRAAQAAINVLGALGGGGRLAYSQHVVEVDGAAYEAFALEAGRELLAPSLLWLNAPAAATRR